MEEQSTVAQTSTNLITQTNNTYAADYTERYPKVYGRKLGVLTQVDTNTPVQQLSQYQSTPFDVVTETSTFVAHISDSEKLEGTGAILQASNSQSSCKRIKQTGGNNGNGVYTISPIGADLQVYCDMETAGGGWTLIGRSATGSIGSIGWEVTAGSVSNDNTHYSLGSPTESMSFSEIMVGRYSSAKDIDYAIKFDADSDNLDTSTSTTFATSNCELIVSTGLSTAEKSWSHCNRYAFWGDADNIDNFFFSNGTTGESIIGLLDTNLATGGGVQSSADGAWHGKQGMVFIK